MLQDLAIFGGLSDESLVVLLEHVRAVHADVGEYYFREHERANALFVVDRGRVEVLKSDGDRHVRLSMLGPGECFGEMALLAIAPRSASVRAVEKSVALQIGNRDLFRLYQHSAEEFALLVMNMAREVSRRLWVANELLFRFCDCLVAPGDDVVCVAKAAEEGIAE